MAIGLTMLDLSVVFFSYSKTKCNRLKLDKVCMDIIE